MLREKPNKLQDIPNIGRAIERELARLGITTPTDLIGRDPYQMYTELGNLTGRRPDPCLVDVFIAAVRYVEGGPARKWWEYTAERKARLSRRKTGR